MKEEIKSIYIEFIDILKNNGINNYYIADLNKWKLITIGSNKEDIKGISIEVSFTNEGINITYEDKNGNHTKKEIINIDELISTINSTTKLDIVKNPLEESHKINCKKKHL